MNQTRSRTSAKKLLLLALFLETTLFSRSGSGAGVTLITHGLNSNVDDWVLAMARAIPGYPGFPGTNFTCYEIYFATNGASYVPAFTRLAGGNPLATDSGEIVVKLDWRQLANNNYSTYQVASNVVPRLLQTNFIPELGGHALAEFPLHLVGHSRGGSLMCEISRLLGTNGIWVDHLTTLDPHPLNNDGFSDFPYTVVDAPARTYQNVLFHDNYYQTLDSLFHGEVVAGAYTRRLTNLNGGYSGLAAYHSDVHLWYHGTVDERTSASDSVVTITSADRQAWWTAAESNGALAGFIYSRLGGGDRLATNQPAGPGTGRVRDGFNQHWDLGAGLAENRTALPTNSGLWPNIVTLNLTGTNVLFQGQSATATFNYQWAQPATAQATLKVFLDPDSNPLDQNERLLATFQVGGTGAAGVASGPLTLPIDPANLPPGVYALGATLTDGIRVRYLYAPGHLQVLPNLAPPTLALARFNASQFQLGVQARAGQTVILEGSTDLRAWQPLATNTLTTNEWVFVVQPGDLSRPGFYRAIVPGDGF